MKVERRPLAPRSETANRLLALYIGLLLGALMVLGAVHVRTGRVVSELRDAA